MHEGVNITGHTTLLATCIAWFSTPTSMTVAPCSSRMSNAYSDKSCGANTKNGNLWGTNDSISTRRAVCEREEAKRCCVCVCVCVCVCACVCVCVCVCVCERESVCVCVN